jgi:large conductance mechanosensitive channel
MLFFIDKIQLFAIIMLGGNSMKKMINEFKQFIARGNVLDLAVGVLIGSAFQGLVSSLTDNIISPLLGCFSEVDFSAYELHIANLNLKYGAFLTDIINFLIMAFVIFLLVKGMNKLFSAKEVKEEKKEEPKKSDEVLLLEEIRDLLSKDAKETKKEEKKEKKKK